MPKTTAHPSREQLSAYNLGQLPPDNAVAVESHVSECEPCCDTIIELSSDDTFIATLREARQLPIEQTVEHGDSAKPTPTDVPAPLAEHPRYEILGLIGKGGMGDVYKAQHRKMERTVALKVISRQLFRKSEAVDRFHREVKTAAQLSHPNIVTSYDADQAGDFHFMVMEYVGGVDLSQTVKDRGALPVAEACDYIRQAATGLQHAHECGMVHRDIKPHNLMVTHDGTVKILDFGLASLAPEAIADADTVEARGELTAAGAIMGTPDFISPEQADDARKADIRSDIYSLGATLYFLLAGRPPFAEGSVTQKLKSHAQAEPEPLESLRDDVPPELIAVVKKMTAKDPEERYLTPSEVADALESFLRIWRQDEAASSGQVPFHGGHGSGSNGQIPGTGDAGPDWLPVAAQWFFYLTWIPIALLMWEGFFTDQTSDAADVRFYFYIAAAVCLSTIAGALGAAQRLKSDAERGDRRIFRMTAGETMLVAGILIFAATYVYKLNFSASDGYSMVSAGAGSSGDGWYVSAGSTYLKQDEPGVLFGMCENPEGDRSFSYIVLFRHEVNELTEVSSAGNTGLQFDGETASIRDGLSIDGKGIELDLEMRMDRQEIQSSELVINGTATDASRGRLFLVDLTSNGVTWNQVNAKFPLALLAPKEVVGDTYLVAQVARQITEQLANDNHQVRKFLAGATVETSDPGTSPNGKPVSECAAIQAALREYYMDKYPLFSASVNQRSNILSDPSKLRDREWLRQIGELGTNSPVSEVINSFPGKPYVTFTEVTQASRNEVLVVCVNLYRNADETCRVEVTKKQRKKRAGEPVAVGKPITEEVVRKLVRRVVKDSDFKQLQGDWEVIAATEDGEKEFVADKDDSMQLRVEGNTLTRIGTTGTGPHAEKSERLWGRIELDSTTNPKSIDIISAGDPDDRFVGIYEIKAGALKLCYVEQSDIDVQRDRPIKRPTTFAAPAGSELVLLECQRNRPENAALVYWQAFALLPELSEEDAKRLTDLEKGSELGVDARSLLTRSKTALSLISHLQPGMPCRWELIENGPSTLLPHLSKAQTLARLMVLQARVDAKSGKTKAAVGHLIQAFLVARNVDEGVLVQMVVGDAIESLAADVALSLLPELDDSSRDRFAEAFSKLPNRTTFTQAMRRERDVFGRGAAKMMSDALEQLGKGEDSPAVRAVLAATEKRQAMWLEELLAEYDKVIAASELPLAEANKDFERIEEEVQDSSNPLIQLMMPSLVGTNEKHASVDARIAKLETRLREAETSAGNATTDREEFRLNTTKPIQDVQMAIRNYYVDKYPLFAASVNQRSKVWSDPERLLRAETRRQIGQLSINSPVSEVINSFPGKPLVTFTERSLLSQTELLVTNVNLYQTGDDTCRIVVTKQRRRANADQNHARGKPITVNEIRKLVTRADSGDPSQEKKASKETSDGATTADAPIDSAVRDDVPAGVSSEGVKVRDSGAQTSDESKASVEKKTTGFLIEAAKRGDLEAVEAALKAGVASNPPSNLLTDLFTTKQLTALHWAVAQRISEGQTIEPSPEITKRLIEAGADVNAADYLGQTPLEWAVKHGTPETVKMLIKAGANVAAESRYGTVLEAAKNVEIAKLLIEAGADVNAGTTMTPLANAAKSNQMEMVQLLIEQGAKVNDPQNPPIHWAGKPEVAKALIKAGADVNQRNGKGETVLHLPSMYFGPNAETVKLLLEAGADVNAKSQTDATPLHAAIEQNKAEIAKLLIAAGAQLDAKDKEGNTPLSLALRGLAWARRTPSAENKPYEALKKLLVDAGAKDDGRTKLQQAVAAGDVDQVKKLIAAQVDVNETGPQKITALHLASEKGNKEILAMLIEAGAKPDQADSQGLRPLYLAANAEMARMLIAANARINTGMPSPLYMATITGKADVVRELVKNKANIQDSDCAGILNWAVFAGQIEVIKVLFNERDAKALLKGGNPNAPLHVAASGTFGDVSSPDSVTPQQRLAIAKFLVEKGADVNARWGTQINPQSGAAHMIGTTPLMFASLKGEAEMVKFLLEKGGKVNATNAVGQTPLHFAAQSGHAQIVDLLLKAKADVNALTKETKTPLDLTQNAAVKILLLKNRGKTATEALKDSQR